MPHPLIRRIRADSAIAFDDCLYDTLCARAGAGLILTHAPAADTRTSASHKMPPLHEISSLETLETRIVPRTREANLTGSDFPTRKV